MSIFYKVKVNGKALGVPTRDPMLAMMRGAYHEGAEIWAIQGREVWLMWRWVKPGCWEDAE